MRTKTTYEEVSLLCKALAHPMRVRILLTLLERQRLCGDLVSILPLAQSTVSEHIRILKAAGLVEDAIEGVRRRYGVNRRRLAQLKEWMNEL